MAVLALFVLEWWRLLEFEACSLLEIQHRLIILLILHKAIRKPWRSRVDSSWAVLGLIYFVVYWLEGILLWRLLCGWLLIDSNVQRKINKWLVYHIKPQWAFPSVVLLSKFGVPVCTFLLPHPDIRIPLNMRQYFPCGRWRKIVMMIPLEVEPPLSPPNKHGWSFLSFHLELHLAAD